MLCVTFGTPSVRDVLNGSPLTPNLFYGIRIMQIFLSKWAMQHSIRSLQWRQGQSFIMQLTRKMAPTIPVHFSLEKFCATCNVPLRFDMDRYEWSCDKRTKILRIQNQHSTFGIRNNLTKLKVYFLPNQHIMPHFIVYRLTLKAI